MVSNVFSSISRFIHLSRKKGREIPGVIAAGVFAAPLWTTQDLATTLWSAFFVGLFVQLCFSPTVRFKVKRFAMVFPWLVYLPVIFAVFFALSTPSQDRVDMLLLALVGGVFGLFLGLMVHLFVGMVGEAVSDFKEDIRDAIEMREAAEDLNRHMESLRKSHNLD
ncbi:MAG: hypothetical protein AAF442_05065 [Pseudomonadota bacterium]